MSAQLIEQIAMRVVNDVRAHPGHRIEATTKIISNLKPGTLAMDLTIALKTRLGDAYYVRVTPEDTVDGCSLTTVVLPL